MSGTEGMDVVYILRAAENNEPLRYSLRTLANVAHRHVWLVGYQPRWAHQVGYVPTQQRGPKHVNTWANWTAAARCDEISDEFLLFNDDFFITRPATEVPILHRGNLDEVIGWYRQQRLRSYQARAQSTRRLLQRLGRTDLLSYELHVPMVINRQALREAVDWFDGHRRAPREHFAKRTFYGNFARVGGVRAVDVKAQGARAGLPETEWPFLSTSPLSWSGLAGGWVRRQFAQSSPYERDGMPVERQTYRPPGRRRVAHAGR